MAKDSKSIPDPSDRDATGIPAETETELRALIDVAIDDALTPDQASRLEQLVVGNRAAALLYYRAVHLSVILPLHLSRGSVDLDIDLDGVDPNESQFISSMNDAMILPAISGTGSDASAGEVPPIPLLPSWAEAETDPGLRGEEAEPAPLVLLHRGLEISVSAHSTPPAPMRIAPKKPRRRSWWWAAAAIVLATSLWATLSGKSSPKVAVVPTVSVPIGSLATITATAEAVGPDALALRPRSPLVLNQKVLLDHGSAEITFASGAVLVVTAPAQFGVSDKNAFVLDYGDVAAHVPVKAHGFRVKSPGLSVVDLGTNFAVRARKDSQVSEVHVFTGLVDATSLDGHGKPAAAAQRLSAGQGVGYDARTAKPIAVTAAPTDFIRDIESARVPVAANNTGVSGPGSVPDPKWLLTEVRGDLNWKPVPAIILPVAEGNYTPNTAEAKWIMPPGERQLPVGQYVFSTTLDLTGIDVSALSATAYIAADNYVQDVRVNGASALSLPKANPPVNFMPAPFVLKPPGGWVAGPNKVDILVINTNFSNATTPSAVGVRVVWDVYVPAKVLR